MTSGHVELRDIVTDADRAAFHRTGEIRWGEVLLRRDLRPAAGP